MTDAPKATAPYRGLARLLVMQALGGMFTLVLMLATALVLVVWALGIPPYVAVGVVLGGFAWFLVNAHGSNAHIDGSATEKDARSWRFMATIMDYFPIRLDCPADVDLDPVGSDGRPAAKAPQYLFGVHPHGIHALGATSFVYADGEFARRFPRISENAIGVVATILFFVPFVRHIFLAAGYRDAGSESCNRILEEGKSLFIVIGGEIEALETEPGKEKVFLSSRKGFVRLALRHRVPLVPTYSFGQNEMYAVWHKPFYALRKYLVKAWRVCIPLFAGRFGVTQIPYEVPIDFAVGKPLPLPAHIFTEEGKVDEKVVDEYHAQYVHALQALFEERKAAHGFADRKLIVL